MRNVGRTISDNYRLLNGAPNGPFGMGGLPPSLALGGTMPRSGFSGPGGFGGFGGPGGFGGFGMPGFGAGFGSEIFLNQFNNPIGGYDDFGGPGLGGLASGLGGLGGLLGSGGAGGGGIGALALLALLNRGNLLTGGTSSSGSTNPTNTGFDRARKDIRAILREDPITEASIKKIVDNVDDNDYSANDVKNVLLNLPLTTSRSNFDKLAEVAFRLAKEDDDLFDLDEFTNPAFLKQLAAKDKDGERLRTLMGAIAKNWGFEKPDGTPNSDLTGFILRVATRKGVDPALQHAGRTLFRKYLEQESTWREDLTNPQNKKNFDSLLALGNLLGVKRDANLNLLTEGQPFKLTGANADELDLDDDDDDD